MQCGGCINKGEHNQRLLKVSTPCSTSMRNSIRHHCGIQTRHPDSFKDVRLLGWWYRLIYYHSRGTDTRRTANKTLIWQSERRWLHLVQNTWCCTCRHGGLRRSNYNMPLSVQHDRKQNKQELKLTFSKIIQRGGVSKWLTNRNYSKQRHEVCEDHSWELRFVVRILLTINYWSMAKWIQVVKVDSTSSEKSKYNKYWSLTKLFPQHINVVICSKPFQFTIATLSPCSHTLIISNFTMVTLFH